MNLTIGKSRFGTGGQLTFQNYHDGSLALVIIDPETGERQAVASVFMEGAPLPDNYHVWLKGWSENEGLPEALVKAGAVRLTDRTTPAGWVQAIEAELIGDARKAAELEMS